MVNTLKQKWDLNTIATPEILEEILTSREGHPDKEAMDATRAHCLELITNRDWLMRDIWGVSMGFYGGYLAGCKKGD